jgi:hypothetical protein
VILRSSFGREGDNDNDSSLLTTTTTSPNLYSLKNGTALIFKARDLKVAEEEESEEDSTDSSNTEEEGEDTAPFKAPQDALEFMDYFEGLLKKVQTSLDGVFDQYLPQLFEMSSSVNLSPDCTYDIVRVVLALREMKPWAIKCECHFQICQISGYSWSCPFHDFSLRFLLTL